MRWLKSSALAVIASIFLSSSSSAEVDSVDQAYMAALFSEPGRIEKEMQIHAERNPPLMAYFIGLSVKDRCGTPEPSKALFEAGGGDKALETREGRWTFIVGIAAGTMSFPKPEDEIPFCAQARKLIETSEEAVRKP